MTAAKIAISIDRGILSRVDSLVQAKRFRSRSEVFQSALSEQLARLDDDHLARECARLNPAEEQAFADIGLSAELAQWPAY